MVTVYNSEDIQLRASNRKESTEILNEAEIVAKRTHVFEDNPRSMQSRRHDPKRKSKRVLWEQQHVTKRLQDLGYDVNPTKDSQLSLASVMTATSGDLSNLKPTESFEINVYDENTDFEIPTERRLSRKSIVMAQEAMRRKSSAGQPQENPQRRNTLGPHDAPHHRRLNTFGMSSQEVRLRDFLNGQLSQDELNSLMKHRPSNANTVSFFDEDEKKDFPSTVSVDSDDFAMRKSQESQDGHDVPTRSNSLRSAASIDLTDGSEKMFLEESEESTTVPPDFPFTATEQTFYEFSETLDPFNSVYFPGYSESVLPPFSKRSSAEPYKFNPYENARFKEYKPLQEPFIPGLPGHKKEEQETKRDLWCMCSCLICLMCILVAVVVLLFIRVRTIENMEPTVVHSTKMVYTTSCNNTDVACKTDLIPVQLRIQNLDQSVETLDEDVGQLNSNVQSVNGEVLNMNSQLKTVGSHVDENGLHIGNLDKHGQERAATLKQQETKLTSVNNQVSGLVSDVTQQEQELTAVNNEVSGLASNVTQHEQQLTAVNNQVSGLSSDVTEQEQQLTAVNNQVSGLVSNVTQNEQQLTAVNNQVSGLASDVAQQEQQLTAVNNQVSGLVSDVTNQGKELQDVENRLMSLEQNNPNSNDVSNLEAELKSLESELKQLGSTVEQDASNIQKNGQDIGNLETEVQRNKNNLEKIQGDTEAMQQTVDANVNQIQDNKEEIMLLQDMHPGSELDPSTASDHGIVSSSKFRLGQASVSCPTKSTAVSCWTSVPFFMRFNLQSKISDDTQTCTCYCYPKDDDYTCLGAKCQARCIEF